MTTENDTQESKETTDASAEAAVTAAMDALDAGALNAPEAQPETLEAAPAEPVAKPQDPPEAKQDEQPIKPADAPAAAEQVTKPEQPPSNDDAAPSSWKRDVAEKWAELPTEVKAEIQRREAEYHQGIERYKPAVQFAQEMNAAITPYVRNIQASGIPAPQAMNHLLMIEDKLRNGDEQSKLQTLVKIAHDYGVDLQKAGQTPPDPRMWQMEQQLHQERMARENYQRSQADRDNQAVTSEIEAFASAEGHEHFESVKADMAVMLQSGMAQSLQDAYDKAVWARPELRQSLVEKERTEAEKRATEQAQRTKAKSAAVGVKGSPPNSSGALPANASLEDTVAAAMDGLIS